MLKSTVAAYSFLSNQNYKAFLFYQKGVNSNFGPSRQAASDLSRVSLLSDAVTETLGKLINI
jgi:hypothetical protein